MSLWAFVANWLKRVLYAGWDIGDIAHRALFWGLLITAFFTARHADPEGEHDMLNLAAALVFVAIVASLVYCAWRLCKEEYDKRMELEAYLTPKLEFAGVGEKSHGINRVRVRNLSVHSLWFKAVLTRVTPPIDGVATPFVLQPTHRRGEEGDIIGGEYGTADVFVDYKTSLRMLPGSPVGAPEFPIKDRYELIICASCQGCPPVYRRYYIVKRSDGEGGVIFTDGGEYWPPGVPGGPKPGQTASA